LEQLCEELGVEDVELTYSTDDFENWTVQKLFNQYVQPLIVEKNPHVPKEHIVQILDAKWKEFAIMNPYIPKGEEDLPDDEEESSTLAAPSNSFVVEDEAEAEDTESTVVVTTTTTPAVPRRVSSRHLRAAAAAVVVSTASATSVGSSVGTAVVVPVAATATEIPGESGEVSQSSPASSSAAATPASSQAAPLRIKISKKKKRKTPGGRSGGRRREGGGRLVGDNTSDEEFERQLEEAEALQEEEQKRRKQQRSLNARRAAAAARASAAAATAQMHVSASAPNLAASASGVKRSIIARVPLMGGNRQTEDGYETDHQDYCDVCQQGGNIMLCDTCPRAYHLVCLDPELEEVPEGVWSCPHCEKQGITAAHRSITDPPAAPDEGASTASEGPVHVSRKASAAGGAEEEGERDEHQEYCSECRDGGDLICCENCPASYHLGCLDPPLSQIPEGVWLCPRCGCKPLKGRVSKILFWRWREPPKTVISVMEDVERKEIENDRSEKDGPHPSTPLTASDSQTGEGEQSSTCAGAVAVTAPHSSGRKKPTREFFVKFHEMSYWACEWVTELQLEVFHSLMLRVFSKKYDMEEPPLPEDGSSYRSVFVFITLLHHKLAGDKAFSNLFDCTSTESSSSVSETTLSTSVWQTPFTSADKSANFGNGFSSSKIV
uniref:PHD-type domain-containing protein n=1 Tax=Hydatigena taeniaeformis TaxID=6205 RepID=A0A0R3XBN0_HYDTA